MSHKVIGTFGEINGKVYEDFDDLRKDLKLIGSVSDDVGDVKIYYTNEGVNYVVAHNSEEYYGKEDAVKASTKLNDKTEDEKNEK